MTGRLRVYTEENYQGEYVAFDRERVRKEAQARRRAGQWRHGPRNEHQGSTQEVDVERVTPSPTVRFSRVYAIQTGSLYRSHS